MRHIVIDSHIHFGIDRDGSKTDLKEIEDVLKECKIDRGIIFPFDETNQGQNFKDANLRIVETVKSNKELIGGFRLNPMKEFKESMQIAIENNLKVLKLHPRSQRFSITSKKVCSLFEFMENTYNVPIFVHVDLIPKEDMPFRELTRPKDVIEAASRFRSLNFILCHAGRLSEKTLKLAQSLDNVYFETSVAPLALIAGLINAIGSDRIIFGSDYPYSHPILELGKISFLDISKTDRAGVLSENIAKLVGA